jgi:hypothetical protein
MSKKPLKILKSGLSHLKETIKVRKDKILQCLSRKEQISDNDANWLDNEVNLVEEEHVISILENAHDYE